MSYQEDTVDWQAVEAIDLWLDSAVSPVYRDQPLAQHWARVAKIGEELGEAINALIGMTGQNPRKGFFASQDELTGELADVVFTGILAIQHITKSTSLTREILRTRLTRIEKRVPR